MDQRIAKIHSLFSKQIQNAKTLKQLDDIFLALFGKKGQITVLPKQFIGLSKAKLQEVGPLFNSTKNDLERVIDEKREQIKEKFYKTLVNEKLDLESFSGIKSRTGYLHPLTEFENRIAKLFYVLGFYQYDGPDIDTDENNFGLLNIPSEHPARDLWDTLYIDSQGPQTSKLLLRTHTSNTQIRVMKNIKPPFRMMTIGRCYRYENLDARHEHTFDQFEIIYVDRGLSMANLQYLSEYLLKNMFGDDTTIRLSPGYYPFTEPSAHIFGLCAFCKGKARLPDGQGCKICGNTGELELAGAGMIHPQVLRNCGIDPNEYSGIAWGVGPGRMAMLYYDVDDVRLFNSGDLNFLTNLRSNNESL